MYSFETNAQAKEFVRSRVDQPVSDHVETLGDGVSLHAYPLELTDGKFTNVYDVSYHPDSVRPEIGLHNPLVSVYDYAKDRQDVRVATGGGFFFLADRASALPRHLGLNLAFVDGQVHSFPVVDREAVFCDGERLSAEHTLALGMLGVNGSEISWSGSLTAHDTDAKVYANGNSVIAHVQSDATGSVRVLDESSRYTPEIDLDDLTDIGFIRRDDGVFVGVSRNNAGGMDIFGHDVVVRTHERFVHSNFPELRVLTLGNRAIDAGLQGGVSVGPMLNMADYTNHPVNKDASLGGKPPFLDVPLARVALFETGNGAMHLRLFDGRPGSPVFPGVTPNQAAEAIHGEDSVVWGCFLDPGQTAKLVTRSGGDVSSYGNTHYLKWPELPDDKYVWVPKTGRPVASTIALR